MERFERLKREKDRGGGGLALAFKLKEEGGSAALDFVRGRGVDFVFGCDREDVCEGNAGAGVKALERNSFLSTWGLQECCGAAGVNIGAGPRVFRFCLRARFSFALEILNTLCGGPLRL